MKLRKMIRLVKKIRRKLHNPKGFTLAEILLAILIMLMVSSIVAAGIPAARESYEKVVLASNADILLSTTVSALRNEIGASREVDVTSSIAEAKSGTCIEYYSLSRNAFSVLYVDSNDNENIKFQRYYSSKNVDVDESDPEYLIPPKTATDELIVTYSSATYDKDKRVVTFTGLSVRKKTDNGTEGKVLAKRDRLSIKTMSDKNETE